MNIQQLFKNAIERGASDIHLVANYMPTLRINNELYPERNFSVLTSDDIKDALIMILSEEQKDNLFANKELDFSYEFEGNRFRVNAYFSKNTYAAAFRLIGTGIRTIEELSLPLFFHNFATYHQGLVLITGPTGEGKSTTLASVINEINQKYSKHIITIEDPIEYVYAQGRSIVSQRELHQDTHSWTVALKSVLREDPDVVLIGEMRDYETIQMALTIAETGHLVFSTLHTASAPETIDRIIDVFPSVQQNQVRMQLSSVLKAVVAQRLLPNLENTGRIPALEVLFNVPAVASSIRESRTHLLTNIMETGEADGMYLFEKYLTNLFEKGLITRDVAYEYALRPSELKRFLP